MTTPPSEEQVKPELVFQYADRFRRRAELAGKGTCHPSFAQCARRFRCRVSDIEQAVEDGKDGLGLPMDTAVGMKGAGGHWTFEHTGQYLVETWEN